MITRNVQLCGIRRIFKFDHVYVFIVYLCELNMNCQSESDDFFLLLSLKLTRFFFFLNFWTQTPAQSEST